MVGVLDPGEVLCYRTYLGRVVENLLGSVQHRPFVLVWVGRELAFEAHKAYDNLSERELQVFKMHLKSHSFPTIADTLEISESSAKTYWRRAIRKCWVLFDVV